MTQKISRMAHGDGPNSRISDMSLTAKAVVAAALLFSFFFALVYGATHTILMRSFADLERQQVSRDVERAVNALQADITALGNVTREWATWNDMYDYAESRNPEFERGNLTADNYI